MNWRQIQGLWRSPVLSRKKIWIDLDISPHDPFFVPIIEELTTKGREVFLRREIPSGVLIELGQS
jgi:hypothetical protein